jgi:hypothetical protein
MTIHVEMKRNAMLGLLLALGCGGDAKEGESGTEGADSGSGGTTASASETSVSTSSGADGSGGSDGGSDGGSTETGDTTGAIPFGCDGFLPPPSEDGVVCFYDVDDPGGQPAASLALHAVDVNGQPAIYVRLIFAPWFVDNTYGANAIGWDGGHTFNELVGSDHAVIKMGNTGDDMPLLEFELDYIDTDDMAASGYRCQGVWDGQGKVVVGDEMSILAANSSLSRNLNERGYSTYIEDSPATDMNYTPNQMTPNWDYRVIYEAWVDASLFNDEQLVEACIDSIHASPAKIGDNTVDVIPDECPPGWGCFTSSVCDDCTPSYDPDEGSDCDPGSGYPPEP